MKNTIIDSLKQSLPAVFSRQSVPVLTGNLISARTLANKDSEGVGPKGRIRLGRTVGYEKMQFLEWLRERMNDIEDLN